MTHASGLILLIDDSTEDYESVRRAFKKIGLENPLVHVSSGPEALQYLGTPANTRPCLILLDLNMPGMSGHEVLKVLKQDETLKEIPVVILTGMKGKLSVSISYKYGANAYIMKSADFEVLADNIRRLKEYWLDTVELPQVFDEEAGAPGEKPFVLLETGETQEGSHGPGGGIYLAAEEVYTKIMGPCATRLAEGAVHLTPQEIETLTWVARGKSRWEIGIILGVSEDTIKARLEKCRQKLNASNTTHAIAIALLHGLLING